jgi:hypothetical protein
MKYARVMLLFVATLGTFKLSVSAQDVDPVAAAQFWVDGEVLGMLADYEELVPPDSDLEDTDFLQSLGLEGVAALQDLRREFEDEEPPACAFPIEAAFVRMIDLTTDSIVAALNNDSDADNLGEDAMKVKDNAMEALDTLDDQCKEPEPPAVATIGSLNEGDSVTEKTIIEGTFDEEALGDNSFWVVILAEDGWFYIQSVYNCETGEDAQPVTKPFNDEWRVTVEFGGDPPQLYTVILALADPDETNALVEDFGEYCLGIREFPRYRGLDEPGLEAIQAVDVRKEE